MNNKYKKGQRVIYKGGKARVVLLDTSGHSRAKILIYNSYTVNGMGVVTWINSSEIENDTEYYREQKLRKLLKNG